MCHCTSLNQFSSRATDIPVCALLALKLLWIIFVVVGKFFVDVQFILLFI